MQWSAWVERDGVGYGVRRFEQLEVVSPVFFLLKAIYRVDPRHWRHWTRRSIHLMHSPRGVDHGTLKVLAKRWGGVGILPSVPVTDLTPEVLDMCVADEGELNWVDPLSDLRARVLSREVHHGRNVGAVAFDGDGKVLSWALSEPDHNPCDHAEMRMLQKYYLEHRRSLPVGTRVHVTLEPCRMCAEHLVAACEDSQSLRVNFDERDPGPMARGTVLERMGLIHQNIKSH